MILLTLIKRVFVVVAGCGLAPLAHASPKTASEALRDYDSGSTSDKQFFENVVSGINDGIIWSNTYIETVRKERPLFCPPGKLILTGPQLIDMVRRHIAEKPSDGKYPVGMVILMTERDTFPCTKQH